MNRLALILMTLALVGAYTDGVANSSVYTKRVSCTALTGYSYFPALPRDSLIVSAV